VGTRITIRHSSIERVLATPDLVEQALDAIHEQGHPVLVTVNAKGACLSIGFDPSSISKMRERRLFFGVISSLVALAISSLAIASYSVAGIEERLVSTGDFHTDDLDSALSMNASVSDTAQEAFVYVVTGAVEERDEAQSAIARFDELVADFERADDHGVGFDHAASIVENHRAFALRAERMFTSYESTGAVGATEFAEFEESLHVLTEDLVSLVARERAEVIEAQADAVDSENRARDSVRRQGWIVSALTLAAAAVTIVLFRQVSSARETAQRDLRLHVQALEATSVGVVISDACKEDAPVIYVNPAFEAITGYTRDETIGRNCRFLQGPRTDEGAIREMREAIERAEPRTVLIENYTADGRAFWNELHLSPIRTEAGVLTHFVGVVEDVTERLRLESRARQSGKMSAVGQLAGGIAHDFNNYLMAISGAIELIKIDPDADVAYWLDHIAEAGAKSAALTSQLMTFARAQILDVQTLDLNAIVIELAPLLRGTIREDIALEVHTTSEPSFVLADRSQLEQVITNLVLNARDAMPDGGCITIETRSKYLATTDLVGEPKAVAGDYLELAVTDTGTGVDPEIADQLFEPFTTTKPTAEGGGLGLATVYAIVNGAGGLINVYTEQGQGTTVRVNLPQTQTRTSTAASERVSDDLDISVEGRVLLVEDNVSVREALRSMLVTLGFTVVEAGNGVEALEVLQLQADIAILITDVTMPEMGGIELAGKARAMLPRLKVLLVSGYTETTVEGSPAGDPLLIKPFTLDELKHKLAGFIKVGS
jgi:PAS domain S-box-containing protein